MRPSPNAMIEIYRLKIDGARTLAAGNNGAFCIPYVAVALYVIASDGGAWDHVSVSLPERCPTWDEMCHIKELFFRSEEWVMQLHPSAPFNVNNHPFCLHLWRPQELLIPQPPPWMVGSPAMNAEQLSLMSAKERRRFAAKLADKHLPKLRSNP